MASTSTNTFTPYSSATPYWGPLPQWMDADDAQRIATYQLYEEMYWSQSSTGIIVEDGEPINIPIAKVLIEAIHRFLAVGWDFGITGTDPGDECKLAFMKLFAREQIKSKVSSQKRYGLIRGDAMLHIVADPNKPAGRRISVYELDPASYFPIYDLDAPDVITGCHLVDQMTDANDKVIIRRQTYRKQLDENSEPTGVITSEIATFETAGWDDRFGAKPETIKQISIIQEETPLPPEITSIPVYHWKNIRNPGDIFGSSTLRGLEKALKAIDQTITDEDVALALASLGVYATDSAPPVDGDGNETGWIIGPARVIEVQQGRNFQRVSGITSVQPSHDHMDYIESKIRAGAGVPSIAAGDVDVASAESGIALALKLMPLLSANSERELEMLSVLDQFLYDLQTMWFPAYEQLTFGENIVVSSVTKDPMPVNRDAIVQEVTSLLEAGVITVRQAIEKMGELGWSYSAADIEALVKAAEDKAAAAADPFGDRVTNDLTQGDQNEAQ